MGNGREENAIIIISGVQTPVNTAGWSPLAARIYEMKNASPFVYAYASVFQVRFEMEMRAAIVAAAEALSRSGLRFSDFNRARCNERFWILTELGGFRIRPDVTPAAGLRDIFENGYLYATECATATAIAVYKGALDVLGDAQFNRLFRGLLLYDWHLDDDLRLTKDQGEAFPGDLLYFNNPDYNPETPQWRGENVIMIAENLYYGHPVGIVPGEVIIDGLNRVRRPFSMISAYLTDDVVRPDYKYLAQFAPGMRQKIFAWIGSKREIV
jgi:protein-glutamine gamma-glutamyltransferase